jgi:hemolysin activation/secretion protein
MVLAGANTGHTPISYLPFSVTYGLNMPDDSGLSAANMALNFHVRGLGDRKTDCLLPGGATQVISEFECKRINAQASYFYLRGGMERTQNLTHGMSLFSKLDGQMASGLLISNEQFTAGGSDSVRGYLESEQAGDDGAHAAFELRGPQWVSASGHDFRLATFLEGAHLRVRGATVGQTDRFNLSSVGFDMKVQLWKRFSVDCAVGWPLKQTTFTSANKARVGFKAVGTF